MYSYTATSDLDIEAVPRVVYADDHRIVAEGIERVLGTRFELAAVVPNGKALIDATLREAPDIILSDLDMPVCNGLDALKYLRSQGNETPFIFLTMHSEPALAASAMRAGANGYLLKVSASEELMDAMTQVLEGSTYVSPSLGARYLRGRMLDLHELTPKQREVLLLVGSGLRSKQIAAKLGLSVRTVEAHKYMIMQVLDVHSTLELVRRSEELGLLF